MNVVEAEVALREARIAEAKERNKADREKYVADVIDAYLEKHDAL